jgi:hypothetical protein
VVPQKIENNLFLFYFFEGRDGFEQILARQALNA